MGEIDLSFRKIGPSFAQKRPKPEFFPDLSFSKKVKKGKKSTITYASSALLGYLAFYFNWWRKYTIKDCATFSAIEEKVLLTLKMF